MCPLCSTLQGLNKADATLLSGILCLCFTELTYILRHVLFLVACAVYNAHVYEMHMPHMEQEGKTDADISPERFEHKISLEILHAS